MHSSNTRGAPAGTVKPPGRARIKDVLGVQGQEIQPDLAPCCDLAVPENACKQCSNLIY